MLRVIKKYRLKAIPVQLVLLTVFLLGCNRPCDCYDKSKKSIVTERRVSIKQRELNTSHIKSSLIVDSCNPVLGYHVAKVEKQVFFVFYSNRGNLVFVDLTDSSKKRLIPIKGVNSMCGISISNDTLAILNYKSKRIAIFQITKDFTLNEISVIELGKEEQLSKLYLMVVPGRHLFKLHSPWLLVPFGNSTENNYIEQNSYLAINIITQQKNKILPFPNCYNRCYIRDTKSSIDFYHGNVFCIYNRFDSVYKYNLTKRNYHQAIIQHHCKFFDFDKTKKEDLAYIRTVDAINEVNLNLCISDGGIIGIVKKKGRLDFRDEVKLELHYFTANLDYVGYSDVPVFAHPYAFFSLGNEFLLFSEAFAKIIFYEPVW